MVLQVNITAVEIDAAIVEIAEKWFGVTNNNYRKTIISDGTHFLNKLLAKSKSFFKPNIYSF